ncbi:MAG: hypothetical protein Q8P31_10365 [Bacillota bacterium]|nr:hypothetical protein [Bacillota bacterium]
MTEAPAQPLLDPHASFPRLLDWLNASLLPRLVDEINELSARMLARMATEELPHDQRHLTDVRTRIGAILEYFLALSLDTNIRAMVGQGFRVTYVPAQTYPDLYLRQPDHTPTLRFEVKAIETISEEKSANFDALLRDVWRNHDILCVLLWEWQPSDRAEEAHVVYPRSWRPIRLTMVSKNLGCRGKIIVKLAPSHAVPLATPQRLAIRFPPRLLYANH